MIRRTSFYRFSHNSSYNRGFAWAASIIPRSAMVDRVCPQCNAVEHYPSGAFDVIVEGGSKYPDILGCGAYPFLIVSERVVNGWEEAGITCFHTYPVGIAKVKSKRLSGVQPPQYLRVEIDGHCDIDLVASGIEVVRFCPECHHLVTRPSLVPGFRIVPHSWDRCALFRDAELYPRANFCTEQVLNLAATFRWTNFRFEPMEGPYDSGSKGINYLNPKRS